MKGGGSLSNNKVLLVVESPTKAKTISRILGHNYIVKSSMGHIRDLPKSRLGIDIEHDFQPHYINIRGKGEIIKDLREASKASKQVLLAPDPDREGEAIAWHLQQVLDLDPSLPCRIEFNEITEGAVKNSVKHPRPVDLNRVDAQQARRVLDRLVGYGLSPLLWKKIKSGLSAGRVQSVAVRLIVEREKEIEQFRPEEYWTITAVLRGLDTPQVFEAELVKCEGKKAELKNKKAVQKVIQELQNLKFAVSSCQQRSRKRMPDAPFTTSTLQQEAYKAYNFTARKTMSIAQQLYEGVQLPEGQGMAGLITYMRTDSTRVAETAVAEARHFIAGAYGPDYVPPKPHQFPTPKGAQAAHECIRPTSVLRTPDSLKACLTKEQFNLYELIWKRFVACQMSPAELFTTTLEIIAGPYLFRASGSQLVFAGFLKLLGTKLETQELPQLEPGQEVQLVDLKPKQHFTQPPPRFTDASLVKTMEELGIGRPSTYAPTIDTILRRGYVVRENRQFVPTELGKIVTEVLKEHFPDIVDVDFTAHMESKLDQIESGELSWVDVVQDFYQPFKFTLEQAEHALGKIEVTPEETTSEKCEKCGRSMVVKTGRYGRFLACSGFPECRNTKPLLEEIGVPCPLCGAPLVTRYSKKGRRFYGCSRFPACEFVSWDKPTNQKCPKCQEMLLEKRLRGKTILVCSREGCGFKEEMQGGGANGKTTPRYTVSG